MEIAVIITFIVLLCLSVPIGITLAITAVVGLLSISPDPDFLNLIPMKFIYGLDSFTLLTIPLFILTGAIMAQGGIARRIVDMTMVFFGRIQGGLGIVVTISTFFFGAICGSGSAKTAAVGSVMIGEMRRNKYPANFSTALFAAAGGASSLVPPSIDLIIIGVIAGISIPGIFAAGILPALLNGIALVILAYFYARKLNLPIGPKMSWSQKRVILKNSILPMFMIVIIIGGIYGGVFTPTEASAVGVVYGFILSFFIYKELTIEGLKKALLATASLSGVVLLVLGTASIFSFVLTFDRIPYAIGEFITQYAPNWIVFLIYVNIVFFILGMVMDALPAIIVLLPIVLPVAVNTFGIDPIHLGIVIEANVGLGMITPPVGICLFVACGISKIKIESTFKILLPFLLVLFITLMIITFFPDIAMFLPRLMGYAS